MNNKLFKTFLFLFLLLVTRLAKADLVVEEWKQINTFNNVGQDIEVFIKLRAKNLKNNYYHDYWGYIFDKKTKINLLDVKTSSKILKNSGTFGDNTIKVHFDKLFNNDSVSIYFKYQIINDDDEKYIRREWVQIPKFASGAKFELVVKTMENMDVYSTHYGFNVNDNVYSNSGVVGNDGVAELFQMTLRKAIWKVSTNINVKNSSGSLNTLKVVVPLNFVGGNNEIIYYNISSNQIDHVDGNIIKKDKDSIDVKFSKYQDTNAFINIDAKIKNNYNNFYWLNDFDVNDTLKIKHEYVSEYSSLINTILNEDKTDLPNHVKIAKWVNKIMKYDISYVGKKMTSKEILDAKVGVCEHYSILYQDLLRSISIPAKTISGISYSYDKKKFENHAWVMVNYNSQWLPIDPTWGIYSGKLPISHIFLYNDIKTPVKYSMYGNINNVSVSINNKAEYIGN